MRSVPVLSVLLAISVASACEDSSRRRPGGTGSPNTNVSRPDARPSSEGSDGALLADAGEIVEGRRDAESPQPFRDAEPLPTPIDAGVIDVGFPSPPDVGFAADALPFPDAFVPPPRDAGFARDSGPRPDGGGAPADAGPPLQTQVTEISGSSLIRVTGGDVEIYFTLAFDNAGPGAETIRVLQAGVSLVISSQTVAVAPPTHFAPVGHSERAFASVPGSAMPPFDPFLLTIACQAGGGGIPFFPGVVEVTLSNGAVVGLTPMVECVP